MRFATFLVASVLLAWIPKLEKEGLRRLCLIAADDPTKDRAEAGSCVKAP